MAAKANSKDKVINMIYSLGAAIVILGALCKMTHFSPGGIDSNYILALGLITEAVIFTISAFVPPAGDYEWEVVYPELEGGAPTQRKAIKEDKLVKEANISLSSKLDEMLSEARLDASLFERLRGGIENFGSAVGEINKTVEASSATQKYGTELVKAANHMESLNALYQVQLEEGKKYTQINQKFVDDLAKAGQNSAIFQQQLAELTANLNNLNKVYGGMLSAMKA